MASGIFFLLTVINILIISLFATPKQDDLDCISNSGRPTGIQGFGVHYLSQNTSNFEYLQSMLKQKEGEVAQTQWELSRLQAERNMLQEELSQLVMEMENVGYVLQKKNEILKS